MRIQIASDYYPPFIGGGHRAIQALARELARAGHTVEVVTISHPGVPTHEDDAGVAVHRVPHLRALVPSHGRGKQQHHPPFPDPLAVVALRRILRRFRPDVVYAYGWIAYSAAVARAGTGTPLLLGAHDYVYGCPTRTLLRDGAHCAGPQLTACLGCAPKTYGRPKGWLTTLSVRLCGRLLRQSMVGVHSVSSYVERVTLRDFIGTGDFVTRVIPSFSEESDAEGDPGEIARIVDRLPREPFILFVGALRKVKGVATLVEAHGRLRDAPPLVLLGTVEQDTPRTFPEGVVVLEDAPHGAVMQAWERCLFGVAPSLWPEPLGLVVHEGMSRGACMIGTTPGGHTDLIVAGESGLLVPPGDVGALAEAMQQLIDDPELRERLGAAARVRSSAATAAGTRDAYERLFRDAASAPRGEGLAAGELGR